jgi:hypothetical protein
MNIYNLNIQSENPFSDRRSNLDDLINLGLTYDINKYKVSNLLKKLNQLIPPLCKLKTLITDQLLNIEITQIIITYLLHHPQKYKLISVNEKNIDIICDNLNYIINISMSIINRHFLIGPYLGQTYVKTCDFISKCSNDIVVIKNMIKGPYDEEILTAIYNNRDYQIIYIICDK